MFTVSEKLEPFLHGLQVPAEYTRYENITEATTLTRLAEWKTSADRILKEVQSILDHRKGELLTQDHANIIASVASFDGEGPWIMDSARSTAQAVLSQGFPEVETALLVQLLTHNIKPRFQLSPHPWLDASGRKLLRPAGGTMGSQDFYDEQSWKSSPGIVNVLSWCVRHVSPDQYANLWHLIIPPVMSLLDDFAAKYKLRGCEIVAEMLLQVPGSLLKRTGLDSLIRSSLNTCLTYLNNPEAPQLIKASVATSLALTKLTTSAGSAEQFDQLCALLGDGIISGIWLYAYDQPDIVVASLEALAPVLRALKIGNARFLKLLRILMEECAPCIPRWKTAILDGIVRSWVTLKDRQTASEPNRDSRECRYSIISARHMIRPVFHYFTANFEDLRDELRHTCESLGQFCPSVIEVN
ncbi:hypothetical protein H0H81_011646 [Sphagnurus paluster]|uniref:Uncharacterized protein n=1 Tax=Sphagnurus paluster TaxID=117069 RepID=A0A9P7FSA2_9AGAR|nr:hypothetical protein H0H81_011646 [Sphagnurus paluster]